MRQRRWASINLPVTVKSKLSTQLHYRIVLVSNSVFPKIDRVDISRFLTEFRVIHLKVSNKREQKTLVLAWEYELTDKIILRIWMCFFRLWLVGGLQLISAWLGGALVLQCSSLGGARLWVPGGCWRGRRVRLCCAHLLQVHSDRIKIAIKATMGQLKNGWDLLNSIKSIQTSRCGLWKTSVS